MSNLSVLYAVCFMIAAVLTLPWQLAGFLIAIYTALFGANIAMSYVNEQLKIQIKYQKLLRQNRKLIEDYDRMAKILFFANSHLKQIAQVMSHAQINGMEDFKVRIEADHEMMNNFLDVQRSLDKFEAVYNELHGGQSDD